MITEKSLNKIAIAGFSQQTLNFLDYTHFKLKRDIFTYTLFDQRIGCNEDGILLKITIADNELNIDPGFRPFNHAKAVRKMEELGIVKAS